MLPFLHPMRFRLLLLSFAACVAAPVQGGGADEITLHGRVNEVVEWGYTSDHDYADPFAEIVLDVVVTGPDGRVWRAPAFWAGDRAWRVRFAAPRTGAYTFRTECSDTTNAGLHGQTGRIVVAPYDGANPLLLHGPIRIGANRRHLEHADGTPFFWLADSWWHGMTDRLPWPDGFELLTRDRREKGFSVIQFAVGFPCDIEPFDPRGANAAGDPWTPGYGQINPAYFDLTDQRIGWLVREGLVPNVVGSWGYYLPDMGVEKMKRHWRYLIARYGAYPVVWSLSGESTLPWYLADDPAAARAAQRRGWAEVARYIEATDPYGRVLTVHPGPNSGGLQPIDDMAPIDLVMLQPGHNDPAVFGRAIAHLREARARYPDRPMLIGEVCFEGMKGGGCGAKSQRYLFWSAMLSGAAGHSYGADAIWQFNTREAPFGASPLGYAWGNTPWEDAYRWPGAAHVALGKRVLEAFAWWRIEPRPEWIAPSADEDDVEAPFAAGIGEDVRLFYFPREVTPWGREIRVLRLEPGRTYRAAWLDPITGTRHPLGLVQPDAEGAWTVPVVPILQDWVLVLE